MDKAKEFYTTLGLKATKDYSQAGRNGLPWRCRELAFINLSTMTANFTKSGMSKRAPWFCTLRLPMWRQPTNSSAQKASRCLTSKMTCMARALE